MQIGVAPLYKLSLLLCKHPPPFFSLSFISPSLPHHSLLIVFSTRFDSRLCSLCLFCFFLFFPFSSSFPPSSFTYPQLTPLFLLLSLHYSFLSLLFLSLFSFLSLHLNSPSPLLFPLFPLFLPLICRASVADFRQLSCSSLTGQS